MVEDQGQTSEASEEDLMAQLRARQQERMTAFLDEVQEAVRPIEEKHRMRLRAGASVALIGVPFTPDAPLTPDSEPEKEEVPDGDPAV